MPAALGRLSASGSARVRSKPGMATGSDQLWGVFKGVEGLAEWLKW
jgi:hypothetical protein